MAVFPILKGSKLRITKTNACGLPIAGPANRVVTDGFVQVGLAAVNKEANDIEQLNAEGKVCVADRTPPVRKYYTITLELCQVNTCAIALLAGLPQVLNYAADAVGFRDKKDVDVDFGAAVEVWTGGTSDEDCPAPETDDVFQTAFTGRNYGYFLFGGKEWRVSSDWSINADVSTVSLQGITIPMTNWGRGPYNVVEVSAGVAGRLLTPFGSDPFLHVERTPVPPPDITPGSECVELAVATIFQDPNFYFGGPGGAPAADVAPDQPTTSGS